MNKPFFKIIIPNYNGEEYIEKCINSILSQTFTDYTIVIIDDMSLDNSCKIIKKYINDKLFLIPLKTKRWNGGSRNVGIHSKHKSKYTMFLDYDDTFTDSNCLQTIHDLIMQNNNPDCIRLSYKWCGDEVRDVILNESTPEALVENPNVACWTKCIKSELIQDFPENTLREDVIQHIKQCDVLDTIVPCTKPIVNWNRKNPNSVSTNVENYNSKFITSLFRYCADLMELIVEKPCCEAQRLYRLNHVIKNIQNGIMEQ